MEKPYVEGYNQGIKGEDFRTQYLHGTENYKDAKHGWVTGMADYIANARTETERKRSRGLQW